MAPRPTSLDTRVQIAALILVDGFIAALDETAMRWVQDQLATFAVDIGLATGAAQAQYQRVPEQASRMGLPRECLGCQRRSQPNETDSAASWVAVAAVIDAATRAMVHLEQAKGRPMPTIRRTAALAAVALTVEVAPVVAASPASAASFEHCPSNSSGILHWASSGGTVPLQVNVTNTGDYAAPTLEALNSWQSYWGSPFSLSYDSGAKWRIYEGNDGNNGYDGWTNFTCQTGGLIVSANSHYNTYYASGYDQYAKRQVMAHEIGHALGLGHAGSTADCTTTPIMFSSSDRWWVCTKKSPQTDDINGIDTIY